ncbi:multifunctional acyl-CoA thioesterase I/protease I/lysophospholipase L1 [Brenneria sp. L3-3Z]
MMNFKNVFRGPGFDRRGTRWTGLCKHIFILLLLGLFSVRAFAADTLLILGDSLSAGYRMPAANAWPALLNQKWQTQAKEITVINASISGDTAAQGLARLPALLKQHQPRWVLIELGGNDGLRGFPAPSIEQDLTKIITQVKQADAQPLLMQIRLPTNYGRRYTESFSNIYPRLAQQFAIPLVPFFMEQVYLKPEWILEDGIHPTRDAQPFIADWMAERLGPLVNHES